MMSVSLQSSPSGGERMGSSQRDSAHCLSVTPCSPSSMRVSTGSMKTVIVMQLSAISDSTSRSNAGWTTIVMAWRRGNLSR